MTKFSKLASPSFCTIRLIAVILCCALLHSTALHSSAQMAKSEQQLSKRAVATKQNVANKLPTVLRGTVAYHPAEDESGIPEYFRLKSHTFSYVEELRPVVSQKLSISRVTFPSPVVTPHLQNNTVYCEYYRPMKDGQPLDQKRPAVVMLHILGGDFELCRLFCNVLAHRGVAALFLKMPYYGERKQPGVARRMISNDPRETVEGMKQAVLDIRRAVAWLAARDDVDPQELGICGISLGGITAALAATAEPRLKNICLLLAGGDMGQIAWQTPELAASRRQWLEQGGTRQEYVELLKVIDPVNYAANVRNRRILMLNAKQDEIIPRSSTLRLWKSFGEPEIVWYEGGHYSVGRHIFNILKRTASFYEKPMN